VKKREKMINLQNHEQINHRRVMCQIQIQEEDEMPIKVTGLMNRKAYFKEEDKGK